MRRSVLLPWSGRTYTVTMPTAIDPLLDLAADDPEQNLPYWAELWPSGIALADLIEQTPRLVRGKRVFELGCGLGVTATGALRAGAVLTVGDYSDVALNLCRVNCEENAGVAPVTVAINWRRIVKGRKPAPIDRSPVVLAADVLYERRDIDPMVAAIGELLEPGGVLWLAEPGRPVAAEFLARVEALGWQRRSRDHAGPWPDQADEGVIVGLHELRPPR